jgi:hypothetical protein
MQVQIDPVPVWDSLTSTDKNNSLLVDDGSAQALTAEEIERMKKEGVKGE